MHRQLQSQLAALSDAATDVFRNARYIEKKVKCLKDCMAGPEGSRTPAELLTDDIGPKFSSDQAHKPSEQRAHASKVRVAEWLVSSSRDKS